MVGIIFSRSKLTNLQKQVTPSKLLYGLCEKPSELPKNPDGGQSERSVNILIIKYQTYQQKTVSSNKECII